MAPRLEIHVRLYQPGDRDRVLRLAPRLIEGTAPWRDPAGTLRAVEVALRSAALAAASWRPYHSR